MHEILKILFPPPRVSGSSVQSFWLVRAKPMGLNWYRAFLATIKYRTAVISLNLRKKRKKRAPKGPRFLWLRRHYFDVTFRHFVVERSIDTIFGITEERLKTRIVNTDNREATLSRDTLRCSFDTSEHCVSAIRISAELDRIVVVSHRALRARRESRQTVLLLFEPQSTLAFLCVQLHGGTGHSLTPCCS